MAPLLTLDNVSKYRKNPEWLFEGITAQVQAGERIALLGTSGQGKSTLLRIVSLLGELDAGELRLQGRTSSEWKPEEWRRSVCYVAQTPIMLPGTVEYNLRTVSELQGKTFDEALARRCMEGVGLGHIEWSKEAESLSGGEKQRTALARALLLRSPLLLLDETTSSLDPKSKRQVEQFLSEWCSEEGTAFIWITHDLEQARQESERIWFMAEGRLLEQSATEAFFTNPGSEQARSFLDSQHAPEQGDDQHE
ncbi:ATP-binding cassette domain-containing protein [Paenibacillus sp. BIHB 4019]|uniref:ABC transporter ATP-binding protein n=1 Tax=Paenibacillus sp. BIHB 4019 TaxID=1870819 RepID=UPI001F01A819|nr:ATP-binding cassette domain-containing protein [Paenibacillus sp. BIHB 4019]